MATDWKERGARILGQIESAIKPLMEDAMLSLKQRTLAGRSVDGSAFKPYSPEYAKFREKKGRQAGNVDLFFTGKMQSAMTVEVKNEGAAVSGIIKFTDSTEARKAKALDEERKFFSLNDAEVATIRNGIRSSIKNNGE